MQVLFNNSFGRFTDSDISITEVTAIVKPHEHLEALGQGFLCRHGTWRQCRSTRVVLSETNYSELSNVVPLPNSLSDEMIKIHLAQISKKGFTHDPRDLEISTNNIVLGYMSGGMLVAWSKLFDYVQAYEAQYFAWNYADPKERLGIKSLEHEIASAKKQGHMHFYIGPGYETCSIYKSKVAGFEWWTGSTWSKDIAEYVWLCQRDSNITNFREYSKIAS